MSSDATTSRSPAAAAAVPPAATGASAGRWLRLLIVGALLVPGALFALAAWQGYHAAVEKARERVLRSAAIAEEHAHKMMRTNDVVIDRVADVLAEHSDAAKRRYGLQRIVQGMPELKAIVVFNAQGTVELSSSPAWAEGMAVDRNDYFSVHRAGHAGIFLSPPLIGRDDGVALPLIATRERPRVDGHFQGAIGVVLPSAMFTEFYRDLSRDEPGASVSLFRPQGTVVVRYPAPDVQGYTVPASGAMIQRVKRGDANGLLTIISPLDGQTRLIAFERVPGYALYVSSSIKKDAIVRPWLRDMALLAAFTFPIALMLAGVAWVALRRMRLERVAIERWRDETARRAQIETVLRQTQRLEALGHLTGGVAHDVNNLLMVVNNSAYRLKLMKPEQDRSAAIDAILRAVAAGAQLTRQLLSFARRQPVSPEVVRLRDHLEQWTELMRHSVPSSIAVSAAIEPDTGCIEVDLAELELALINLAVNARDAMPEGGQLSLHMGPASPSEAHGPGEFVSLRIRDTGQGMASDVAEHVFEPFFTTKPSGHGTGLGLSQVYGFCTQAGGRVALHSELQRGTVVTMVFPRASGEPPVVEAPPPVPAAQGRLLLVEDNPDVAASTEPVLANWGYDVTRVASADAARLLLDERPQHFELMLSDIVMPGAMDGLALARWARVAHPRLGVVLMSGYTREAERAVAEGFTLLQKPWAPPALAQALVQAASSKV